MVMAMDQVSFNQSARCVVACAAQRSGVGEKSATEVISEMHLAHIIEKDGAIGKRPKS